MNSIRRKTWALSLWVGLTAAGTPEPLTLEAAVAEANRSAPQLQARMAAAESANLEAVSAGRLPAPEIVAGIENLPVNGADAWVVDRDFMTMRKIGVMQSFGNAHRREAERSVAQAHAFAAHTEALQAQLEVSLAAAQTWISVQTAEQTVAALEALQPNYDLQVRLATNAVATGRTSTAEALMAQSSAAELADRLLEARQRVAASRAELGRWIGAQAERPLGPAPSYGHLQVSPAALQEGVHHHAELRALDARVEEAREAINVAAAARRPDWSTEISYAQRGPGFSNMVSVEIRMSLPLFSGSRVDPSISAHRAAVRQLQADRQAAFQMHSAELATMLADWQAAADRLTLYEQQRLPLARQRSKVALAGLAAGTGDAKAVVAALGEQLNLELSYVELRGGYGRAWAYLNYMETGSEGP